MFDLEELYDQDDPLDPRALALYMYENVIPPNRNTQRFSDYTTNHIYSISINKHDLHEGDFFVSVKCQSRAVRRCRLTPPSG